MTLFSMEKKSVYCMHCARWYAPTQEDQCDISEKEQENTDPSIIGFRALAKKTEFGHPSELNRNNNCPYYQGIGLVGKIERRIFFGIPLRPTINSKVN